MIALGMLTGKGHRGTFWSVKNILYLDQSNGYTNTRRFAKNLSRCIYTYNLFICVPKLKKILTVCQSIKGWFRCMTFGKHGSGIAKCPAQKLLIVRK